MKLGETTYSQRPRCTGISAGYKKGDPSRPCGNVVQVNSDFCFAHKHAGERRFRLIETAVAYDLAATHLQEAKSSIDFTLAIDFLRTTAAKLRERA